MGISIKERLRNKSFDHVATKTKIAIGEIEISNPNADKIKKTYNAMLDFMVKKPMQGGCHFYSVAMFILLREQGVDCELLIGDVDDDSFHTSYCHSWVEIDEKVYDLAIMFPRYMDGQPPVFAGIDLDTNELPNRKYGISKELHTNDKTGLAAYKLSVSEYLDGDPKGKNILWEYIIKMGKHILRGKDVVELREKYKDVKRSIKYLY
ncbi:lasso peptide biosynthesis protein [Peribacillus sp. AS_2]|uniref:lasso peptide biosynthesis protein n=1 Tax=Peribacillus sp. AS_2 TaxID=2996755 RepID=UPI0022A67013|nr:lasso peptide biosynthesis protein [Peribacillus sp. AS_2]MCZ0872744.1 lasso peptide biosynthesis protein [Peribacillus sp. AS_2]